MHENQIYTNVSYISGKIHVRGVDLDTGKRFEETNSYQPRLFIENNGKRKGNFSNMFGTELSYIEFGCPKDAKNFISEYEDVPDFEVYGQKNMAFDYISRFLWERSANNWDPKHLRIGNIDIETQCEDGFPNPDTADEIVNVITVYVSKAKKFATFALGEVEINDPDVELFCYDTEERMLEDFLSFWEKCNFDIITGWNVRFFDIPYLYSRICKLLGDRQANRLSPYKWVKAKTIYMMGKEQTARELSGTSILDYLELYLKYAFTPLESYKLDTVAKHEDIEGKLPWEEKYDSMKEFYSTNFQEFVEYNIQDVRIVKQLEEKRRFIELHAGIAYMAGVNFEDAMSPIRTWEAFIYNKLYSKEIVCPIKNIKSVADSAFQGAYVKNPNPGLYKWVASFDVTSLYPSIINALNISPETFDETSFSRFDIDQFVLDGEFDDRIADRTFAANGYYHDTSKGTGILPQLVQEVFANRAATKKQLNSVNAKLDKDPNNPELTELAVQLNSRQMAYKILMNSLYGAISNKYFIFYNLKQAEAVTLTGQTIIRRTAERLDKKLNEMLGTVNIPFVVYSDTDSVYLTLNSIVEKTLKKDTSKEEIVEFVAKICKGAIEPLIANEFKDMEKSFNWLPNFLYMNREIIAEKALWTGKKRYVCLVNDTEGVRHTEPKIKITGIEVVRSSTPQICRIRLKESLKYVLGDNESDIHTFVENFRKEFMAAEPKDIAFPRSANGLKKYNDSTSIYGLKTPICTKGSLLYNYYLKEQGLTKKYEKITEGDKVKFIYLKEPNPIKDKVIAFPKYIPAEFKIEEFIDYELMFEKAFLEPLRHLLAPIGWNAEKRNTVESLFT